MGLPEILLLAFGLAMDASAVSLGIGTTRRCCGPRPTFRLAFHFGLFQALMPVLGWIAGTQVAQYVSHVDHWVALILLAFIGIRMVRSGLSKEEETEAGDPSRGLTLVMLAVATSIDAFAIGLSLAMLHVNILYPSAVIGIVTAALCVVALIAGRHLGSTFGKRMEILGGLILNGIGIRVFLMHIL